MLALKASNQEYFDNLMVSLYKNQYPLTPVRAGKTTAGHTTSKPSLLRGCVPAQALRDELQGVLLRHQQREYLAQLEKRQAEQQKALASQLHQEQQTLLAALFQQQRLAAAASYQNLLIDVGTQQALLQIQVALQGMSDEERLNYHTQNLAQLPAHSPFRLFFEVNYPTPATYQQMLLDHRIQARMHEYRQMVQVHERQKREAGDQVAIHNQAMHRKTTQQRQKEQQQQQKRQEQTKAAAASTKAYVDAILRKRRAGEQDRRGCLEAPDQLTASCRVEEKLAAEAATQAAALLGDGQDPDDDEDGGDTYQNYTPSKVQEGQPHPDPVVESASLAAVEPPDVTYRHALRDVVSLGKLSSLQLESVIYASQRHQTFLDEETR